VHIIDRERRRVPLVCRPVHSVAGSYPCYEASEAVVVFVVVVCSSNSSCCYLASEDVYITDRERRQVPLVCRPVHSVAGSYPCYEASEAGSWSQSQESADPPRCSRPTSAHLQT